MGKNKLKTAIFITARTKSTRLPKKVLLEIKGKTIIEHLIERLKLANLPDLIVLCTSTNPNDDILVEIAKRNGIECFRGHEDDVLDRFEKAAALFNLDFIAVTWGDEPFCDPEYIDKMIELFKETNADYIKCDELPVGTFTYGLKVEALRKACQIKSETDTEIWGGYFTDSGIFDVKRLKVEDELIKNSKIRLTIDYPEDFEFIKEIFDRMGYEDGKPLPLRKVIQFVNEHPELQNINKDCQALYEANTKRLIKTKFMPKKNSGIKLWNKAKKIIPGGTQLFSKRVELFLPEQWPSYFKKAKGVEVWDLDGNKYIDMSYMGIGTGILGHADPDVNKAVKKVIDEGTMSTLNSPEEVELAELLIELHPWAKEVRFARTGGEAMAVAVRIARAHTGKDKVAFCGYHGWCDWYLAANLADKKNLDGQLLPGLDPAGVPRGLKGTAIPFNYNRIEELEKIVKENDVGVIVMEPRREHEPEKGFLENVRKIANRIGAVLIFDEITSGFRMNVGGIHMLYKVYPDIAVFAKAMSNGYPMAAVIGRKKVMDAAEKTFISSSYWTERIGPVAAIATIKKMKKYNVPKQLVKTGKAIGLGWQKLAKKHGLQIKIMNIPSLATFKFDHGKDSQALHTLFTQEMLKRGFLASKSIYVSYGHKAKHIQKYLKNVDEIFNFISKAIKDDAIYKSLEGPVAHTEFKRLT